MYPGFLEGFILAFVYQNFFILGFQGSGSALAHWNTCLSKSSLVSTSDLVGKETLEIQCCPLLLCAKPWWVRGCPGPAASSSCTPRAASCSKVSVDTATRPSSSEAFVLCCNTLGHSHWNLTDLTEIRCLKILSQVSETIFSSANQEPHPFARRGAKWGSVGSLCSCHMWRLQLWFEHNP